MRNLFDRALFADSPASSRRQNRHANELTDLSARVELLEKVVIKLSDQLDALITGDEAA